MIHGAWCGMWSLANPSDAAAIAKNVGLGFVHIMVNDHSTDRDATEFRCDTERVKRLAEYMADADVEPNITSWIMPHHRFIEDAAGVLVPLCEELAVSELMFDAEEPWTQARERLEYEDAASLIADCFVECNARIGLTGIVYTPIRKIKPLADVCSFGVPQVYATTRNRHNAMRLMTTAGKRYYEKLELEDVYPGLAAYSQNVATLTNQIKAASRYRRVCWWHLRHIRNNKLVKDAIRPKETTTDSGDSIE